MITSLLRRHPRLTLVSMEFELAWVTHRSSQWTISTASAMARRFSGSKARPREGGDSMLPSDFCRRNVVLRFQEDGVGIRLPHPSLPPPA
jgi:hypothetical protein